MKTIEPLAEDSIQVTTYKALQIVLRTKEPVVFDFNGVRVIIFEKEKKQKFYYEENNKK